MGRHRLPAIANRLRVNRGFDSAWYSDAGGYAKMLQRDWLLSKHAWSWVARSSRSMPRTNVKEDPAKLAQQQGAAAQAGAAAVAAQQASQQQQPQQDARDFPNFRPARVFLQHLPYKSVASVFAYTPPRDGPQAKYGLFQPKRQ